MIVVCARGLSAALGALMESMHCTHTVVYSVRGVVLPSRDECKVLSRPSDGLTVAVSLRFTATLGG